MVLGNPAHCLAVVVGAEPRTGFCKEEHPRNERGKQRASVASVGEVQEVPGFFRLLAQEERNLKHWLTDMRRRLEVMRLGELFSASNMSLTLSGA